MNAEEWNKTRLNKHLTAEDANRYWWTDRYAIDAHEQAKVLKLIELEKTKFNALFENQFEELLDYKEFLESISESSVYDTYKHAAMQKYLYVYIQDFADSCKQLYVSIQELLLLHTYGRMANMPARKKSEYHMVYTIEDSALTSISFLMNGYANILFAAGIIQPASTANIFKLYSIIVK